MEQLYGRLAALLAVKSLVTLALTAVFVCLALRGTVSGGDFLTVFLMVISFLFRDAEPASERREAMNRRPIAYLQTDPRWARAPLPGPRGARHHRRFRLRAHGGGHAH